MSTWEMEMNDATMERLAKAIARHTATAQLSAADDLIDSETATWPEEYLSRARIPRVGDLHQDGRPITQVERYEAFRAARPGALHAIEREKREQEERQRIDEENRARVEAETSQQLERNRLQNVAAQAQYEAELVHVQYNGGREPAKPVKLPETAQELAVQRQREFVQANF